MRANLAVQKNFDVLKLLQLYSFFSFFLSILFPPSLFLFTPSPHLASWPLHSHGVCDVEHTAHLSYTPPTHRATGIFLADRSSDNFA